VYSTFILQHPEFPRINNQVYINKLWRDHHFI